MNKKIRPINKKILAFRESKQTTTKNGIALPESKVCASRNCIVLAISNKNDPIIKTGQRFMVLAYDKFEDFEDDSFYEFNLDETPIDCELNIKDNKLVIRGSDLVFLSEDMLLCQVVSGKVSDQKEFE